MYRQTLRPAAGCPGNSICYQKSDVEYIGVEYSFVGPYTYIQVVIRSMLHLSGSNICVGPAANCMTPLSSVVLPVTVTVSDAD